MKRLTSILLALLMLVGMALAEETPDDAVLGNWYGLNAQTIIRLTLKEDGEFKLVVGYLSYTGSWQQTAEGGMYATFSVNIVGMSNTLVLELSPVE